MLLRAGVAVSYELRFVVLLSTLAISTFPLTYNLPDRSLELNFLKFSVFVVIDPKISLASSSIT